MTDIRCNGCMHVAGVLCSDENTMYNDTLYNSNWFFWQVQGKKRQNAFLVNVLTFLLKGNPGKVRTMKYVYMFVCQAVE